MAGAYFGLGKIRYLAGNKKQAIDDLEHYLKLGAGANREATLVILRRLQPELWTVK